MGTTMKGVAWNMQVVEVARSSDVRAVLKCRWHMAYRIMMSFRSMTSISLRLSLIVSRLAYSDTRAVNAVAYCRFCVFLIAEKQLKSRQTYTSSSVVDKYWELDQIGKCHGHAA